MDPIPSLFDGFGQPNSVAGFVSYVRVSSYASLARVSKSIDVPELGDNRHLRASMTIMSTRGLIETPRQTNETAPNSVPVINQTSSSGAILSPGNVSATTIMPTYIPNISISNTKSSEQGISDVNVRLAALRELNVCLICDEFVTPDVAAYVSVDKLLEPSFKRYLLRNPDVEVSSGGEIRFEPLPASVRDYYTYHGTSFGRDLTPGERHDVQSMLLSPHGKYVQHETKTRTGFLICKSCHSGVMNKRMPKFAIANNFYFGAPPACLLALTEVELALLTPMRSYGYAFSYTGGTQRKLCGSLVYYKIDIDSVTNAISQFDFLGLRRNVVVLIHGNLTVDQAKRAYARSKIRPAALIEAVKWLIANHSEWKTKSLTEATDSINQRRLRPEVVAQFSEDPNSEKVEDRIEEAKDTFDVFYPDGTTTAGAQNGLTTMEQFRSLINRAQTEGYAVALRRNERIGERTSEFSNNNLVNACLLQFPYGLGGLRSRRFKGDLSTGIMDLHEYVKHLANLSQPHFHTDIFCLVLYNLYVKHLMLLSACFNVRGNLAAEELITNLTVDDVEQTIASRLRGDMNTGSTHAREYLNMVESVSRAVPHSDGAAKVARGTAEAHMHAFGLPTFFLTACPDDDNNIIIQIMAQTIIDDDSAVATMPDATLEERAKARTALRLKFPGICSLFFQYALDIIIKDIVGWDMKTNERSHGIFGETLAIAGSVEEQGRGTLHVHMQIWVREFINAANDLHSILEHVAENSKVLIETTMDKLASAQLFSPQLCITKEGSYGVFEHTRCTETDTKTRRPPEVVDDQKLRHLRHITGQNSDSRTFATCPHCAYTWTNLELTESYLKQVLSRFNLTHYPDTTKRLKAIIVQYQKGKLSPEELKLMPCVIDAAYNHHIHTNSCFCCKASKTKPTETRKRSRSIRDMKREECRYRFPSCPSRFTRVRNLSDRKIKWFSWDGTFGTRQIKELVLRRHRYNAFQNGCCRAISHSQLSCNSNLQFVNPGPLVPYTFYYTFKGTQDEDLTKFERVARSLRDRLVEATSAINNPRSPRSIAIGHVLTGAYAHQKQNVTSAYLASYAIRKGTRFIFSHPATWCPVHDLDCILHGKKTHTTLRQVNKTPFFNNAAMHYLCRPLELNDVNAYDFYSKYDVTDASNRRSVSTKRYPFMNGAYQHPSYQVKSRTMLQCVVVRHRPMLIRIQQYAFPDSASFQGGILDPSTSINEDMEQYAKLVLLLFCPFRTLADVQHLGSYTEAFRIFAVTPLFTDGAKQWLQNLQDCRANGFRLSQVEDELQQTTECYNDPTPFVLGTDDSAVEPPDTVFVQDEALDMILEHYDSTADLALNDLDGHNETRDPHTAPIPRYSTSSLRDKGIEDCGWHNVGSVSLSRVRTAIWEQVAPNVALHDSPNNVNGSNSVPPSPNRNRTHELAQILLERVHRQQRTFDNISSTLASANVLEPNGSARSIVDWGRLANLDAHQLQAFQILTATFILTFYKRDATDDSAPQVLQEEFERLNVLAGTTQRDSKQLICLLHGPGGSGKTTVIDLLLTYARDFCAYLRNYNFDDDFTIVVTAMSGVAATLLNGETTHGAVHLNRTNPFGNEHYERWANTRLLIVDEISFASRAQIEKLNNNLNQLLRQNVNLSGGYKYGGMNIVFAGDFRQLEPVKTKCGPLYKEKCVQFEDWINCFIELEGQHRFRDDPAYGAVLKRIRDGDVEQHDIDWINERVVVDGRTTNGDIPPPDIQYCTYQNRDRDAINAALFSKRCTLGNSLHGHVNDSIIVFCDEMQAKNGSQYYQPFPNDAYVHQHVGESDCTVPPFSVGRFDPALKLYRGCPIMIPFNANVPKGLANGTRGLVQNVLLKAGVQPRMMMLDGDVPINTVRASEVFAIQCLHTNDRVDAPTFLMSPRTSTFEANMIDPTGDPGAGKIKLRLKGTQVPLTVNNATTGHKLQGSTLPSLFVNSWVYQQNWPYVVLSRVRTRQGLFLRKKLDFKEGRFHMPSGLTSLLAKLRLRSPQPMTPSDYASFGITD